MLAILPVEQNVVQSPALAGRAYVVENGYITVTGPAPGLLENPEPRRSCLGP